MCRLLVTVLLTSALSACALSPQMIDIAPRPEVGTHNVGNNEGVAVSTRDLRPESAFGTRGSVYAETSLIRPANDLGEAITQAVRRGLQQQGFNAYNPGADSARLEVQVAEFSYVPEQGSVVNRVEVQVVLNAAANNARGDEYRASYRAGNIYEQPMTPSAKRNQMMLNEVLDRALRQLLADEKLLAFLNGSLAGTP